MADIFDEVSQDLRAEQAQRLLKRYGGVLVVLAVAVVAGVGGWKLYEWRQGERQTAVAAQYIAAARKADEAGSADREDAAKALAALAQDAPRGYRTLAVLREAALRAKMGDLAGASSLWDKVSADESVDPDLRRTADLLWAQHHVQTDNPDIVAGRLAPLAVPGQVYRPLAMELQAVLKLRTGDKAGAVAILRELTSMPGTLSGVRTRAGAMLAALGESPEPGTGAGPQG